MAEAIGLTSAIVGLVTTAYTSCQKLYSTFDGVRNAPKHIATISHDLEDFYLVLGTFQALLDDEEFSAGIVQHAQSGNLCNVLNDCLLVFKEFNTIISEYQAHNKNSATGTWRRLKWTFKESEVKNLRRDLMGCKATLNVAISVANYYNMRATSASTARIEEDMAAHLQELEKLPEILQQMEDLKAAQLPQAAPHGAIDRAGIKIDYTFALRHYTDSAASIYSDMKTPSAPSLQISALETTSSQPTSRFYTAPMSQTSNSDNRQTSRKCTQILVRNVGLHKTMAFQVIPEHTIGTVKSMICERIGLENAEFELLYSSRVLYSSEQSVHEYGIPHDATLTCISFRPNHSPPVPIEEISCVNIKILDGETSHLSVRGVTLVREVKEMWTIQKGGGLIASDCRLIYAGKLLEDDLHLSHYGIRDADMLYLVLRLRKSIKAEEIFSIEIKTLVGETFHLSVRGITLVREVKEMWIGQKGGGFVADDCRLMYDGIKLKDDRHLSYYDICDEDILFLVLRRRTSTKANIDRNDPSDIESALVETPKHRGEVEVSPRTSQAKKLMNKVPSFWKTPLSVPWVRKR